MIIKHYEIDKITLDNFQSILFYGKNNGLKKEQIDKIVNKIKIKETLNYSEKEIIDNEELFYNTILTDSLFNENKFIIINNASDKIYKIINELISKKNSSTTLVLNADILDKKSKLRSLFEKDKKLLIVPFYEDNNQTLAKIVNDFVKEKKISISQENINLIISKCNGDRLLLNNELKKIDLYLQNNKKINTNELIKLINLSENHSISELIDNCLAKNNKRTAVIINENNFSIDDCFLIIRTFINKSKRLLKLLNEFEKNKNLDLVLNNAKPPIFWKDKELMGQQITKWSPNKVKDLIFSLNNLELQIKKIRLPIIKFNAKFYCRSNKITLIVFFNNFDNFI